MTQRIGVIGGTGLQALFSGFRVADQLSVVTDFGEPSSELVFGQIHDREVVFLARHGNPHRIAPQDINYRANLKALQQAGVTRILAVHAVGSMQSQAPPESLVVPDQIIDYSYGRAHSFFAGEGQSVEHIDFTSPFSESLRKVLLQAGERQAQKLVQQGVYGCTQGPRLETAAEIRRLLRDGCDLVGMTAMPEAALARELAIEYASISLVVNWAAGFRDETLSLPEIEQHVKNATQPVQQLLAEAIRIL